MFEFTDKTGALIKLRPWCDNDIDSLTKYANDSKIADNLRDGFPQPYTKEAGEEFLKNANETPDKKRIFAIEVDGEAAGSISVFVLDNVHRKTAEIGYWLGVPFWNRGIMTGAIEHVTKFCFSEFDIYRLFAQPYARNIGSCHILEKCGYTCEGILRSNIYKNGLIFDSCMYSIIKGEVGSY